MICPLVASRGRFSSFSSLKEVVFNNTMEQRSWKWIILKQMTVLICSFGFYWLLRWHLSFWHLARLYILVPVAYASVQCTDQITIFWGMMSVTYGYFLLNEKL